MAWKPLSLLPLFTLHILLEKLECWDPPLTSLISCSELSVTGDTDKYLVLTLSRGCARSPFDSISPNYPLHSSSDKEKEKIETRLFRSCVPMIIPGDHRPPITLHLSISWPRFTPTYSVKTEPIWQMAALEAIFTWSSSDPFVPWVAIHKCTYSGSHHENGPEQPLNFASSIKPIHPGVSLT